MQRETLCYLAAAVIGAAWLFTPVHSQARDNRTRLSVRGDAETCGALDVRVDGAVARDEQEFTLPGGAKLELNGGSRGHIRVRGWDRPDFKVQACRIAAGADQSTANRTLSSIAIHRSGSHVDTDGAAEGEWLVFYLVQAPRNAMVDLEAKNAPISVAGIEGVVKTRVANGPVSIRDCGGEIQARANNGPISFSGKGGNVSLVAQNGPINIDLGGNTWNGQGLEARTVNGPLSVGVADGYRSGVKIESSGRRPVSCRAGVCGGAQHDRANGQHTIHLNGSNSVIRLSTQNGPISVHAPRGGERII